MSTFKIRTIEEVRYLIEHIIEAESEEEARSILCMHEGKIIDEDLTNYYILEIIEEDE